MALATQSGADSTARAGREMQLGEPHRVEPPALGAVHQLERLVEGRRVGLPGHGRELVEDAELHA